MRFVYAIIAFLLGLVLLGLGITQLTAETEETYTVETEGAQDAPFTVITDDVIDADEDRDEFTIEAEGEYQIALGRTYDVEAWIGDAAHNRLTGYEASEDPEEPSRFVAEFLDGETDVPDPSSSDLWVSVETAEGSTPYRWDTPDEAGDWALLIFREDGEAAPSGITTTETVTLSTAGGIALTVGGALIVLLALGLFYRALSAPRRKKAQAVAAAESSSAEDGSSESAEPKSDDSVQEAAGQPAAAWALPSVESTAEEDQDAGTGAAPASAESPFGENPEAEDGEEAEFDGAPPAESDPAAPDSAESADQEPDPSAEDPESAAEQDDDGDDEDDEDSDPMNTPDSDSQTGADAGERLSGWTKGLRDRLGGGKSPFAVVLAMLVALASAFGLAGPAHADDEEEPETEASEEAETPDPEENDDAAADESESEPSDDQTEGDGSSEEDSEQDGGSEQPEDEDAAQDSETEDGAADETQEGGADQEGAEEPEVEGEMPSEGYSVLLNSQLDRILEDIAETVAAGDEELDTELLEDRVAGKALEQRELAYRNNDLADTSMPAPIGTEVLSAAVSGDPEFPRQAVVIVEHQETEVPQFLVLEQTEARENYKLVHTAMMAPGTEFSAYSAEQGGISVADPGDADDEGSPSAYLSGIANWFADDGHQFGEQVGESAYIESLHEYHEELSEAAEDTEIEIPAPDVDYDQIYAVELPDGSMVVAGAFEMTLQMSPISDGDTIFLDNTLIEEILGTDWTTFPTQIISQEFVVAQIPPEDSEDEIVLLGVDNLVSDANIDAPDWFDGY